MTLLQLAGNQTWPNLLPLLAYRPDTVYFLTSRDADSKFATSVDHMQKAAELSGHQFTAELLSTASAFPTLLECETALAQLETSAIDLVNLTGGTKAMSLAAFRFAERRGIPSFYLDSRRGDSPFDDLGTAPMTLPVPQLEEIARTITVQMALEAQGFPTHTHSKEPSPHQIAFAAAAAVLRRDQDADAEIARELGLLRAILMKENGRELLEKGNFARLFNTPL